MGCNRCAHGAAVLCSLLQATKPCLQQKASGRRATGARDNTMACSKCSPADALYQLHGPNCQGRAALAASHQGTCRAEAQLRRRISVGSCLEWVPSSCLVIASPHLAHARVCIPAGVARQLKCAFGAAAAILHGTSLHRACAHEQAGLAAALQSLLGFLTASWRLPAQRLCTQMAAASQTPRTCSQDSLKSPAAEVPEWSPAA